MSVFKLNLYCLSYCKRPVNLLLVLELFKFYVIVMQSRDNTLHFERCSAFESLWRFLKHPFIFYLSWLNVLWVAVDLLAPAGWVPAGSLLTSYPLAGHLLAGWLACFIHFAIDLLLSWIKNKPNDKKLIKKLPKRAPS